MESRSGSAEDGRTRHLGDERLGTRYICGPGVVQPVAADGVAPEPVAAGRFDVEPARAFELRLGRARIDRATDDLLLEHVDGRVAGAEYLPRPVGVPRVEAHVLDVGPGRRRGLELLVAR